MKYSQYYEFDFFIKLEFGNVTLNEQKCKAKRMILADTKEMLLFINFFFVFIVNSNLNQFKRGDSKI